MARRYRRLLQRINALEAEAAPSFGVEVRVAHDVAQGIREAAYERHADLLVLEWPGLAIRPGVSSVIANLVSDPPTDLVLVRPDPDGVPRDIDSVLVPVRGGPSARLALQTAEAVAYAYGARVTAMHVYRTPLSGERRRKEADHFHELVADFTHPGLSIVEVESAQPGLAILEESIRHKLTVLGAQAEFKRSPMLVSSSLARTVRRLPGTVLLVKSARLIARGDAAAEPAYMPTISERQLSSRVDRWFAENTFHSREFRDLDRLRELKQRQGLTISLALPTLNEEATIGDIVRGCREVLMERHRLLDELVVVDSGSQDGTVEAARAAGAEVVQHPNILPEYGSFTGKGEALWKSLHHLRGDIVAWCDTDISNFTPRFVYGVLGPLLADTRISYVKGFYKRPLRFGGEQVTAGGGRVTELTARPVINLFYPELSGVLQPLSGEYAGRRSMLEQLPFFTGYGVEIGLLIDILETFGLNSIAQVDLGMRIHRNQELFDLSKMAFAIMQVALKRLGDRHRMHLLEEINRSMKLIHYENDRFFLELKDIEDHERPALAQVPEYLARRHAVRSGWREPLGVQNC
ncbi:MAG: glucosyl-3-phosphoglycerate synthase [Chloroflexi bacterium]|nr:MAG: glucosyl-3-phosphoglycerate synthase [Chloroflexota bacterium]TME19239.1 MAG: glucosyl-3-phosphoglycerate synthase [Chloroflexota bacterium]